MSRGAAALSEVLPAGSIAGGKGDLRRLRHEMVDLLVGVAKTQAARPRGAVPAIMAAGRVVTAIEWELEHQDSTATLSELAGGEEKLLEWMRRVMPILEARVAGKQGRLIAAEVSGGQDSDRK